MPNNAFSVLLAKQLGNIRVQLPAPVPAPAPASAPVPAPVAAVERTLAPTSVVVQAAQAVASVAVSTQDDAKVIEFTFKDGTKDAVVVELTADLEAKVESLAEAIKALQTQAVQVAKRLDAIERVI